MKERGPAPNFVPDKSAKWVPDRKKKEKPSLTRRSFLLGVGAFAAVRVLPQDLIDDLSRSLDGSFSEKQRALEATIAAVQKELSEPAVLEALEGEGHNPLLTILRAIQAPLLQEHLKGTSYDTTELHQKYVHRMRFPFGIGNGTYWGDGKTLLTAAHATYGIQRGAITYPVKNIDIDLYDVSQIAGTSDESRILKNETLLNNRDIHGQFVATVGIDIDETDSTAAHDRGHKTYPGIPIKISPGLARRLTADPEEILQMERSFILVLPPGEGEADLDEIGKLAHKEEDSPPRRAKGMSGSTVYTYRGGEYAPAGVFWGADTIEDTELKTTFSVGYFHGIDEIHRVERRKTLRGSGGVASLD